MNYTVAAIEHDGSTARVLTVQFNFRNENTDPLSTIKAAVKEYLLSKEGKEVFYGNGGCFNLADFALHVPDRLCDKYGFCIMDDVVSDIVIDWDEQLVDCKKSG